ncbi:hypothetical protein ACCAA_200119 [Candidatus Accumulibacter aalborgensis]|uniref:DUF1902 domain-containing protein n=1 Tax=Candidatus Accumulibacter aalborgensis TaxID=1860102 RepID=A0A1A8XJL3_9PROT|nr:DUF1902 domain-containing protein [Candidatus Accumulibacter aalborgensis]SBT05374.1 hypothetical protein ACCAA_200119 [Candidatus Accumulibacter aalborgensis]
MNIRSIPTRNPVTHYMAEVIHDEESGMWVASCEALSVATEAPTYDALTKRFWKIAPEVAAENGIDFDLKTARIDLIHATAFDLLSRL